MRGPIKDASGKEMQDHRRAGILRLLVLPARTKLVAKKQVLTLQPPVRLQKSR
jgi:hypothetical protein